MLDIDFDLLESLPDDKGEAFAIYAFTIIQKQKDGLNEGDRQTEMYVLESILAFAIEHEIDLGIPTEIPNDRDGFRYYYDDVMPRIRLIAHRYAIRSEKEKRNSQSPSFIVTESIRAEINFFVSQIKEKITQSNLSESKKDALLDKLNLFIKEFDKSKTSFEKVASTWIYIKQEVGDLYEKIEPLLKKMFETCAKAEPLVQINYTEKLLITGPNRDEKKTHSADIDDIPF